VIEIGTEVIEIEISEHAVLGLDDAELVDDHGRPRPLRRSAARSLVEDDPATREQFAAPYTPRLLTFERIGKTLLTKCALGADRFGASDVEDMVGEEERGEGAVAVGATGDGTGRDRELVDGLELDEIHLSVPLSLLVVCCCWLLVVSEAEK